jgi:FkbM family methyltransferase
VLQVIKTLSFIARHPLSAGTITKSIQRYIAWQLGSRLVPGPVLYNWVEPARILVSPGMTSATGHLYVGLLEFQDMAFVLHALRPHDTFIDVGANVGAYTILASKVVGARTISFEPAPVTQSILRQNVAINGIDNLVEIRREAVGSKSGTARFTTEYDTTNHVASVYADEKSVVVDVPVVSLDSILGDHIPTVVKIDVEGFEAPVIEGAKTLLESPSLMAIIIEINGSGHRYGYDDAALRSRIEAQGFSPVNYLPFERRLTDRSSTRLDNVIYVRDRHAIERRLREAPAFRVLGRWI